jgi:hypothetical protein
MAAFEFVKPIHCGRTPWTEISPSQGLYLHTGQHKWYKRTQTSIPRLEFEPTTPAFEMAKAVVASNRAATVIGSTYRSYLQLHLNFM